MMVIQQNKKMITILLLISAVVFFFGYNEYKSITDDYWQLFHLIIISNKIFGIFLMLLLPVCLFYFIQINTSKINIIIDVDSLMTPKGEKVLFIDIDKVVIISINFVKMGVKLVLKSRDKPIFISWKYLGCGVSKFANLVCSKINGE